MTKKQIFIYTLADSTGNIRYVGRTNNLSYRLDNHISDVRKGIKSHKVSWIKSLIASNSKIILEVLDIVEDNEVVFWERYWIAQIRAWGFKLTNTTSGGEGTIAGNQTSFKKGHKAWNTGLSVKLKPDKNVYQYSALTGSFIQTWATVRKASLELTINEDGIANCARGINKTAGGYIWSYIKLDSVSPIVYKGKTNFKTINKLK